MTPAELWPPLALIRRSLTQVRSPTGAHAPPPRPVASDTRAASAQAVVDPDALLLPLTELARQRAALAQRAFDTRWAPGRLLHVQQGDQRLGVLLDQPLPPTQGPVQWQGWLAVPEADWAGAFDLLLEPQDEPFEPLLGVVQCWNRVRLVVMPQLHAQVVGELSATRLAAVRALADAAHDAAQADATAEVPDPAGAQDARPGHIALRSVAGFSVLTGTPLGEREDPRHAYQQLYAEAAAAWSQGQARLLAAAPPLRKQAAETAAWADRLRNWWGGGALWRPAAAALALVVVVVVQNAGWLLGSGLDDEVRLRDAPAVPTQPAAGGAAPVPDARIAWRPGTDMAAAAALLRQADAQVVGGPDAQGLWALQLLHPDEGRRVLQSSALVELR